MALTPTLTLWDVEAQKGNTPSDEIEKGMSRAAQQLKGFSQAGGQVLFGNDIGYIEKFDTSEEVLSADPAQSTAAFSQVRYTIRDGKIIYSKK
jgi:hypothetical protein